MANNNNNSNKDPGDQAAATQLLGNLPLGALIGGPLIAAIQGQSLAAAESLNFITSLTTGKSDENKDKGGDKGSGTAQMQSLTFEYSTTNSEGKDATASLSVPLLTMVPIPYMRVNNLSVNFKASISAESSMSASSSQELGGEGKLDAGLSMPSWLDWIGVDANLNLEGSISAKSSSTSASSSRYSVEYTVDVSMQASQDDLPAGLMKVLNILQDSIDAQTKDGGNNRNNRNNRNSTSGRRQRG